MKSEVIRIPGLPLKIEGLGLLKWNLIVSRAQNIAVDLIYRGVYTPGTRRNVQQHIVDNNMEKLREVLSDRSKWPADMPSDRFKRRIAYLR